MTDDKGAGEGKMNNPYDHEDCDSDFGGCGDKCKRGSYEAGFLAGRLDAFNDAARLSAEYNNTSVGRTIMNGINDLYLATEKVLSEGGDKK